MKRIACWSSLLTVILVGTSCGDGMDQPPATPEVTARDSAGVAIVHTAGPLWRGDEAWAVSEAPRLAIGEASGPEAYTLFRVRAAVAMNDGSIAIVNGGTGDIRVYDERGAHVRDIGRPGEGPGEFQLVMDLWSVANQRLLAADNLAGRLTLFEADGKVVRTVRFQPGGGVAQVFPRRPFDDGSLLASGRIPSSEERREGLFDGGVRVFDHYGTDGTFINRITEVPHAPNLGFRVGGSFVYRKAPFTPLTPPNASTGLALFVGSGLLPQVSEWSRDGSLLRVIRWNEEPTAVTPEVIDRLREYEDEGASNAEQRNRARAAYDQPGIFPESMAVYESLLVDSEGYLWVERYRAPWGEARRWWVFDPDGRWLGEPLVPGDLSILDIGRDYVLGVRTDANGVERVMLYGLVRKP